MADYATLLRDHITLTCRSIDRIFLQAYVPKLQSVGQVCRFLHRQRGFPIPSSAAFGQIGEAYAAEIHRWAKANGIPVRYFAKKENKEKIAEPLLRAAAEKAGIAYQELDNGFRWCANPAALQRICNQVGPSAMHTSGAGSIGCHRRSRLGTCRPATHTSWPSASSRSPTPACSTSPRPGAPS